MLLGGPSVRARALARRGRCLRFHLRVAGAGAGGACPAHLPFRHTAGPVRALADLRDPTRLPALAAGLVDGGPAVVLDLSRRLSRVPAGRRRRGPLDAAWL